MNAHFTKLNQEEKKRKLYHLVSSKTPVTIWKKGEEQRSLFHCLNWDGKEEKLKLKLISGKSDLKNNCFAHYSLNGLSFLFECELSKVGADFIVKNISNFHKAERRTSFRLLTYPHREVFLKFTLEDLPAKKASNVVDIKSGTSETGLFINFMEMMGEDGPSAEEDTYQKDLKLRVQDLSVTGLCFEVGELEKNYLEQNKIQKDVHLEFESLSLVIPKMEVVYIKEHKNFVTNRIAYRVGVQFHELDEKSEHDLAKKINSYLKDLEHEFEESLKK